MAEEEHLSLEMLIAIIVLVIYVIAAPMFEKYDFHYIHESGLVMILGIVITLLIKIFSPSLDFTKSLGFDDELFFTFILPLIIFGAGYNLKRRSFFKYFMYIFLLGVVGTLIAFGWVCPITYLFSGFDLFYLSSSQYTFSEIVKVNGIPPGYKTNMTNYNDTLQEIYNSTLANVTDTKLMPPIPLKFTLQDALMFASVISATDAVAALTFIHEETEPKLFAILFGEGVVNDAVCIVIYSIIRDFSLSGEPFTGNAALGMVGTFLNLFICSFFIGLIIAIIGSLFLKKLKQYNIGRVAECALIILFAYLSYILTESLHLSPIIALLFNGIINSHYSFYNLSFQAREESSVLSKVLSHLAEAFIFAYLGLTAIHYFTVAFSWSFMIFELITVVCGRFISVLGICFIMESCGVSNFKLSGTEKGIASCSGTIRGAIAFGLSISIKSKNSLNRDILLSTTLSLVFISTVVFGALMPFIIKFFRSFQEKTPENENCLNLAVNSETLIEEENKNQDVRFSYSHPNFDRAKMQFSKEKDLKKLKKRLSYWIGTYWLSFDDEYVKPKLICGWPEVKKEHDEIANVIQNVIKNYLKEKNERKENSERGFNNENDFVGGDFEKNLIDKSKEDDNNYETDYIKMHDSENNKKY